MNKKQLLLTFFVAFVVSVSTQAIVTKSIIRVSDSVNSSTSATPNQNFENIIFENIWKKTFHYLTFFESIDGFNIFGDVSVDGNQLILTTKEKNGSVVEVSKSPTWQGLATFSQRGRFRTAFTINNTNNLEAYISTGGHKDQAYGFKISNKNLYGFSNDGKKEHTIFLQNITNDIYNIEARYKPNEIIVFYVNSVEKGELTNGFPQPNRVPNYQLIDIYLKTTDDIQKSLQISFFEYLQERNVLK